MGSRRRNSYLTCYRRRNSNLTNDRRRNSRLVSSKRRNSSNDYYLFSTGKRHSLVRRRT
jgi:hypothetical protein